jgi:hypothetical protein
MFSGEGKAVLGLYKTATFTCIRRGKKRIVEEVERVTEHDV